MILLPHQYPDRGLDRRQRHHWIGQLNSLLYSRKPLRQLIDAFLWQVALDFYYGHGANFIGFFVSLDIGDGLDEVAQSYKEAL